MKHINLIWGGANETYKFNLGWGMCPRICFKISETEGFVNQGWLAGGKILNKNIFNRAEQNVNP